MDAFSIIQRLGSGRTLEELAQALQTAADEVVKTGKSSTVTMQLKVWNKAQGDVMVFVDETISRSAPKRDPRGAVFFSVEGGLHKDDPRQTKIDFRTVDRSTGEIREIATRERAEREIR